MGIKSRAFDLFSRGLISGLRLNHANKATCKFLEKVTPVADIRRGSDRFLFYCPNDLARWRAVTLLTKEPRTVAWIDTFEPGDVLFDVGASVGPYTIYAARRGTRVVAFEPSSSSYALLNRNVALNGLAERAVCLNVALSDYTGMGCLYMPILEAGGGMNSLGEARDSHGRSFTEAFKQGIVSYRLDDFVANMDVPFPTHIKVDVDGIEPRIVEGAKATLSDTRLRSLMIEVNETREDHQRMLETLRSAGLAPVLGDSPLSPGERAGRVTNYVFRR